jgi:hypothetical protein
MPRRIEMLDGHVTADTAPSTHPSGHRSMIPLVDGKQATTPGGST